MRPSGRPRNPSKSGAEGVSRFRPRRHPWHEAAVGGSIAHPGRYRGRSYTPAGERGLGIVLGAGRPASAARGRGSVAFRPHRGARFYGNFRISPRAEKATKPRPKWSKSSPTPDEKHENGTGVSEVTKNTIRRTNPGVECTKPKVLEISFFCIFLSYFLRFLVLGFSGGFQSFSAPKTTREAVAAPPHNGGGGISPSQAPDEP